MKHFVCVLITLATCLSTHALEKRHKDLERALITKTFTEDILFRSALLFIPFSDAERNKQHGCVNQFACAIRTLHQAGGSVTATNEEGQTLLELVQEKHGDHQLLLFMGDTGWSTLLTNAMEQLIAAIEDENHPKYANKFTLYLNPLMTEHS